jgi:hypothetical protein
MANGMPRDHPLADILVHNLNVYRGACLFFGSG